MAAAKYFGSGGAISIYHYSQQGGPKLYPCLHHPVHLPFPAVLYLYYGAGAKKQAGHFHSITHRAATVVPKV